MARTTYMTTGAGSLEHPGFPIYILCIMIAENETIRTAKQWWRSTMELQQIDQLVTSVSKECSLLHASSVLNTP